MQPISGYQVSLGNPRTLTQNAIVQALPVHEEPAFIVSIADVQTPPKAQFVVIDAQPACQPLQAAQAELAATAAPCAFTPPPQEEGFYFHHNY